MNWVLPLPCSWLVSLVSKTPYKHVFVHVQTILMESFFQDVQAVTCLAKSKLIINHWWPRPSHLMFKLKCCPVRSYLVVLIHFFVQTCLFIDFQLYPLVLSLFLSKLSCLSWNLCPTLHVIILSMLSWCSSSCSRLKSICCPEGQSSPCHVHKPIFHEFNSSHIAHPLVQDD